MALSFAINEASKQLTEMNQQAMEEENEQPRFHHKRGNISSTQTIEKMFMTIAKAKEHAAKLDNCVGFSVETSNGKQPKDSKEYLIHFKEGNGINNVYDIGKWHTFLFSDTPPPSPKKAKTKKYRDRGVSKSKSKSKSKSTPKAKKKSPKAQRSTIAEYNERNEEDQLKVLSNLIKDANLTALYKKCDDVSKYSLLHRGTKDGFKIKSLHENLHNIRDIFMIITSTHNNTFGCYSHKGFIYSHQQRLDQYTEDKDAFIFKLKINKIDNKYTSKRTPKIFEIKEHFIRYALCNSGNKLLSIGGPKESDICIVPECDKKNGSYVLQSAYTAKDGELNGGFKDFKVKELLIYTVASEWMDHDEEQPQPAILPVDELSERKDDDDEDWYVLGTPQSHRYDSIEFNSDDERLSCTELDFDYGIEETDRIEHKVHVYVVDVTKDDFKEPVYIKDIDTDSINHAGLVIGSDDTWDDSLQRSKDDMFIDVSGTIEKLGCKRWECKVIVYIQDELHGDKLLKIAENMLELPPKKDDEKKQAEPVYPKRNSYKGGMTPLGLGLAAPESIMPTISEDLSDDDEKEIDPEVLLQRQKTVQLIEKKNQLKAMRMKYSTRRVLLPGKKKNKQPKCTECNTYYHIQSDPINAYGGIGIICELCGKNREDNPELVLEEFYYKCENCEGYDICSPCYKKAKRELNKLTGHSPSPSGSSQSRSRSHRHKKKKRKKKKRKGGNKHKNGLK